MSQQCIDLVAEPQEVVVPFDRYRGAAIETDDDDSTIGDAFRGRPPVSVIPDWEKALVSHWPSSKAILAGRAAPNKPMAIDAEEAAKKHGGGA